MSLSEDSLKLLERLEPGKKIYFASDIHLGAPDQESSLKRERKVVQWLESIEGDAQAIFFVGDIFDFWFEYKFTIPKGFLRFQSKLLDLSDKGVAIFFFTGNHDMWMFDYFPRELGIPIIREPVTVSVNNKKILVGHGDGLGPGDHFYKFLKKVFSNRFFQGVFQWTHPNIGMWMANTWSSKSRLSGEKHEDHFRGEEEWLVKYSMEVESKQHHDVYIFGHRHLSAHLRLTKHAEYYNLGEWVKECSYLVFDGENATLQKFTG